MTLRFQTILPAFLLLAGCRADPADVRPPAGGTGSGERPEQEWFIDRAQETGLNFTHFNGMSGEFYYPENMAPGVAMLDYDNDGDLDVFVTQGQMLGTKTLSQATAPPQGPLPLNARLFRNDLEVHEDGARRLRFTDVTDKSGIDARGYGMGVAAGDINNDGCVDLYLTNFGRNQMFRNNCDGTFTDVSKQSGADDAGWSVSAAFVDFDRDGWLDLFVGHYLSYSIATNIQCFSLAGRLDYCPPHNYKAEPSHLYHNNRNGAFTDVTRAAGLTAEFGPALGVSTADFNGDGWIDIYVANDGQQNQLWVNQRDGAFKDMGLLSGAALSPYGEAKSSMGVDAADFDNDGDEDLFITELTGQGADLYVNDGSGMFVDESARRGIWLASLPYTGFGAAWFDFDNDGWLDLLAVNGAIIQNVEALGRANDPFPLQQRKQLFRNLDNGRFEDVTDRAGAVFKLAHVSRGAAFGDIDNDGDIDVVIGNDAGQLQLLVNGVGSRNHWLGLRLVGEPTSRDMVGARVGVVRKDGSTVWRRARADGSYASANDPRVLVGLGASTEVPTVKVQWPDGQLEQWVSVAIDRYTMLKEGSGK